MSDMTYQQRRGTEVLYAAEESKWRSDVALPPDPSHSNVRGLSRAAEKPQHGRSLIDHATHKVSLTHRCARMGGVHRNN
jgi:hypothetical protein